MSVNDLALDAVVVAWLVFAVRKRAVAVPSGVPQPPGLGMPCRVPTIATTAVLRPRPLALAIAIVMFLIGTLVRVRAEERLLGASSVPPSTARPNACPRRFRGSRDSGCP